MLAKTDDRLEEPTTFLDTRVKPHIRVINGALDEDPDSPKAVVLNGRIDINTLRFLKVDNSYQRPLGNREDIFDALKEGEVVPNIDVGARGQDFTMDGEDFLIYSPAYIIDGWQRVGTALRLLELFPNQSLRIFVTVHFGTDDLWERHRFTELNKNIKKVSANLHLRNTRDQNDAVLTIFGLSNSAKDFPLYKKVNWSQSMQRGQLISALVLCKAASFLHSHQGAIATNSATSVAESIRKSAAAVTLKNFRQNILTFVSLINECWPLAAIEYRNAAAQIKSAFLIELARLFSNHPVFWTSDDRILTIIGDDRRKLSKFPISDPQVVQLAGTGGASRRMLYQLLLDHMNSGRRSNRLVARPGRG